MNMQDLKSSIKQLAIQRKIVIQDENDELIRFCMQKFKLKNKNALESENLKKDKLLSSITQDKIKFFLFL